MARKASAKREKLAAAAAELFWHNGFGGTALSDIAEKSGVPLGNIYYYFKSKGDLALAVAGLFVSETEEMIAAICETHAEPRERLSALIKRLSQTGRSRVEHGCPIALAVRDFRNDRADASEKAAESFALLIGFIARELGRTGLRPSQTLSLARGAVADWQGGIALAHALKDPAILAESFRRMEQDLRLIRRN